MKHALPAGAALIVLFAAALAQADDPPFQISTSLPSRPSRDPARAFDGDPSTYFSSARPPRDGDDFLVTLPAKTILQGVTVLTGKPNGENRLVFGSLEVSTDGTNFSPAASFTNGLAQFASAPQLVGAVRLRSTGLGEQLLSIREFTLTTAAPLPAIQFQTRVEADWSHASECAEFGQKSAALVREWYPRLRQLLASTNEPPPASVIRLFFLPMEGVAFASGTDIRIAGDWVTKKAPQDYGMVIHELTHVVQGYDGGGEGWLTEGIADYVRDFVFEPGSRAINVDPDKASYRDGYTTTAAFLDWLVKHKDQQIVGRLNAASRARRSIPEEFKEATGKTTDELWAEFTASLRADRKP
jgi:hypothetical protein